MQALFWWTKIKIPYIFCLRFVQENIVFSCITFSFLKSGREFQPPKVGPENSIFLDDEITVILHINIEYVVWYLKPKPQRGQSKNGRNEKKIYEIPDSLKAHKKECLSVIVGWKTIEMKCYCCWYAFNYSIFVFFSRLFYQTDSTVCIVVEFHIDGWISCSGSANEICVQCAGSPSMLYVWNEHKYRVILLALRTMERCIMNRDAWIQ